MPPERGARAKVDWLRGARLFVAVVQHASLSAAGRQLGLSPASASREIRALEAALGARLINRTSRRLSLTESGRIYLGQVETILQQITAANDSVAELQTAARGTLRVHVRNLVGRQIIVPALSDFLTQYPETRVELLMSNDVVDLVERNIDVDIRIGKLEDSALTFRRLATSERIVCAAPAYLDRAPLITAPADLCQHNCLVYQVGLSRPVWRFIDPNRDVVEVAVEGTLCSDNGPSLLDATRAGLGIGLMPDWAIRDDLATGRLLRLLPRYRVGYTEFENGVYAVYQRSRHMPTKVRVFIRFLEGLFRT